LSSVSVSHFYALCAPAKACPWKQVSREKTVIIQMQVFYFDVKMKLLNMCWSRCAGGVAAQTKC